MKKKDESLQHGKDEMNLIEYPITLLSKRHESEVKTLKFSDTIIGDNGKLIKREWTVTGSDEHGLPLAYDNDVLLALLALGKKQGFKSRKIFFSRYRLCRIMGWSPNKGPNYKRIEDTFKRFKGVSIYAKNAFWDNEKKGYATLGFGIIDDFSLFDSPRHTGQDTFPFSYVNLNEVMYESIKAGYIKSVDLKAYYRLESSITKRLYRYLDKKRYDGKRKFEINLFSLAETHLGLQKAKYASQIKQQIEPAHEELIKADFLKSAEYQKTNDGTSEKVIYTFGKKTDLAESGSSVAKEQISAEASTRESDPLLIRLLEIGVIRAMAEQILKEYQREIIQSQVDVLPYREAKDPPAALVSSIREGWSLPVSYQETIQRKKRDEEERCLQEQKKCQEAELRSRVEDYLSKLSDDEMAELRREAAEMARSEGTALFRDRKLSEHVIRGYIYNIVEKRLKVCV